MMKRILPLFMAAFLLTLGSCVKDDIDDLQDQINELEDKVVLLEEEQKALLLDKVAQITALITAQSSDIDEVVANLGELENTVENNKSAIYYGKLTTDVEFAEFAAQGASIVTGEVVVVSEDQIAQLVGLETVGGNLQIKGGTTIILPTLKTVAGSLTISGLGEEGSTVDMPMLSLVGGVNVYTNEGLTGITFESLSAIAGNLNFGIYSQSKISTLDLNGADVYGYAYIQYLDSASVELGNVEGKLKYYKNKAAKLIVTGDHIKGDLEITNNYGAFEEIKFENLLTIEGDFKFTNNYGTPSDNSGGGGGVIGPFAMAGTATASDNDASLMNVFPALETVDGHFTIQGNGLVEIDDFHNVTSIGAAEQWGASVTISENATLNMLNAVTSVGNGSSSSSIAVTAQAEIIEIFEALTNDNNNLNVTLTLGVPQHYDIYFSAVIDGPLNFEGFGAMTHAGNIKLDLSSCIDTIATVVVFDALEDITSFDINLSAENSTLSLEGLNSLTTVGAGTNKLHLETTAVQSYNGTIDIFESLTSLTNLDFENNVQRSFDGYSFNLVWENALPTVTGTLNYSVSNIFLHDVYEDYMPLALCNVPEIKTWVEDAVTDGNIEFYDRNINAFSMISDATEHLNYLMEDACN